jgi:general secretion pathway protein B
VSFILDALKKSESERQRQASPGVADIASVSPRTQLPRWALVLGFLLGINLLLFIVYLVRHDTTPAASVAAPASAPGAATIAAEPMASKPPVAKPWSPLDTPVDAPEIPVGEPLPAAAMPVPTPAPAVSAPPPEMLNNGDNTDEAGLPTVNELTVAGRQGLPELHLDIHVYATRPGDRFVFINMRKYREGAALQEGPTVAQITRGGVVLQYHGLRFLLPRQ